MPSERANEMRDLFDLQERADRVIAYATDQEIELQPKTRRVGLVRRMLSKSHFHNTPSGLQSLKERLRQDRSKELLVIIFNSGMLSSLDRSGAMGEAVANVRSTFGDLGYDRILIIGQFCCAGPCRFYDSAALHGSGKVNESLSETTK
jgi:hypothetical protein